MIAKHISSSSRVTFRSLALYIAGADEKGEKLDHLWAVNCGFGDGIEDLVPIINEVEATQGLNSMAGNPMNYHLMLSFRDHKVPVDDLVDIERIFADGLGLGEHERIAASHANTENFHVHVAYNLVHPRKHTINTPFRDYWKLETTSRAVEAEYGLSRDRGRMDVLGRSRGIPDRARAKELRTWEMSFASYVFSLDKDFAVDRYSAGSWREFHERIAAYGLRLVASGKGLAITDAGDGDLRVKPSMLGSEFGKRGLEEKLGPFEPMDGRYCGRLDKEFKPRPVTRHLDQGDLWEGYREGRRRGVQKTRPEFGSWRAFLEARAQTDPLAREIIGKHRRETKERSRSRGIRR